MKPTVTGRLSSSTPEFQNIQKRTEDGAKIREAFTQAYDIGHEVPPVHPEPVQPIKTPCIGGPWDGATITHMPDDKAARGTNGGVYQYTVAPFPIDAPAWVFVANGF